MLFLVLRKNQCSNKDLIILDIHPNIAEATKYAKEYTARTEILTFVVQAHQKFWISDVTEGMVSMQDFT